MNAGAKLGAYGLVLAAALGGGAALGGAAGPIDVDDAPAHDRHDDPEAPPDHGGDGPEHDAGAAVGGLSIAADGHRFVVDDALADEGEFAFVIEGPDGQIVTGFDLVHEKRLHLVIASRDLTAYTHLHPDMDADGRWTTDLPKLPAGAYRAFADFHPTGGEAITLGVDLTNPGTVEAPGRLAPRTVDRIDGYEVRLSGQPAAGRSTTLELTVRLDGATVTTDPYLGARGHLVALRGGDLGYLHVHPLPDEDGAAVRFAVEVPSAGTYAMFFDFSHDGEVRTARFVIDVPAAISGDPGPRNPPTTTDSPDPEPADDHTGHDDH